MAVVIITSFTKNRGAAKASVRYIAHRHGGDGRVTRRPLYGIDGKVSKTDAYQMIDEAKKGTVFFRIVISPDRKKEDTRKDLYLWQITEQTILLATFSLLPQRGEGKAFWQPASFSPDPTGVGHRYGPLEGRHTEDELLSGATHLLFKPDEGDGAIFTQRASVMLAQLFLAAREEGIPPLPYARLMIRAGLPKAARRLNDLSGELATQFLDVEYEEANLSDRFLLSAWGTLTARMRSLLTETVVRSVSCADFKAAYLMQGSPRSPCTCAGRKETFLPFLP